MSQLLNERPLGFLPKTGQERLHTVGLPPPTPRSAHGGVAQGKTGFSQDSDCFTPYAHPQPQPT